MLLGWNELKKTNHSGFLKEYLLGVENKSGKCAFFGIKRGLEEKGRRRAKYFQRTTLCPKDRVI